MQLNQNCTFDNSSVFSITIDKCKPRYLSTDYTIWKQGLNGDSHYINRETFVKSGNVLVVLEFPRTFVSEEFHLRTRLVLSTNLEMSSL